MGIETTDTLYEDNIAKWNLVRDCYRGESAVKARGVTYLRPLYPGQDKDDIEKWKVLLQQTAEFPNVTNRIHTVLAGALLKSIPSLEAPEESKEWLESSFGVNNSGYLSLISEVVEEDLLTFRTGILVDRDASGEGDPYPMVYPAEHIIGIQSDKRGNINSVRLLESREDLDADYNPIEYSQIRELGIDEIGYYQRLWEAQVSSNGQTNVATGYAIVRQEGGDEAGKVYPRLNGSPMDFIPFWLANGCIEECKPPLLDIAKSNIHLYNKITYDNHAYYTYNTVTPFIAGISEDEAAGLRLGSVWAVSSPEASVSVLAGQADVLREGRSKIEEAYTQIGALGATMFGSQNIGASNESAEALRIRNAPNSAVLGMLARTHSEVLSKVFQFAVQWRDGVVEPNQDIRVEVHNSIDPEGVNVQELTQTVAAVAQGLLPVEVLYYVFDKAELLPADFDPVAEAEAVLNREPEVPEGS